MIEVPFIGEARLGVRRITVIAVLFLSVLALTGIGQYRVDPDGFAANPGAHVYRAVQLFGLEGDWTHELAFVPVEIQVARLLAPLVTVASLMLVFARGAWVALVNVRARFARNHVVLVGLNPLGWHFARSCREMGLRAVAVERDEANPNVEICRSMGVPVIVGDALLAATLLRAGVERASHLVTFVRDDGTNVEITLLVKWLSRQAGAARSTPLRLRCHLANAQLAQRLEQYPKFFLDPQLAEVSFFNVHGLAARTLLLQHPPDVYADVMRRDDVHIVIFGGTALGEQVMLQVARMAHYANFEPPRITFFADDAEEFGVRMARLYPELHGVLAISYVEMPLSTGTVDLDREPLAGQGAAAYVVCLEDESEALSVALSLRRATLLERNLNAPVMVAMERSDGLARLLESELGTPEIPDGIYPFGMLDEIMSAETIVDERLDLLAQAFHENYLDSSSKADGGVAKPSQVPWRILPEEYRDGSRLAADHLDAKLRAVGCREAAGDESVAFADHEINRLAAMERNRFVAVRYSAGWHKGAVRSDVAHVDDRLEAWKEIDPAGLEYDINAARDIPAMLSRIGRCVRREVIVGVTGHRPPRLGNAGRSLDAAIERTLDHIAGLYPGALFVVLSSLAEGADRLVARLAMARLDAQLHVALPLPYDVYVEEFGTVAGHDRDASLAEFHELLGQAERYFEMPLAFGSIIELGSGAEGAASRRARQYALAGAYIVQRSHELIAVWDGGEADGEGGTTDVIGWRNAGVPDDYRFPQRFVAPVEPTAPFVVPVSPPDGFRPQRHPAAF